MCFECTGLCCQNHFRVSSNKCIQFIQLDPKLLFRCVSDHFVTMHKVVQNWPHMCFECTVLCSRNQFRVSSNKCIQFTQLDPKLLFGCVSDHFVTMHKVVQNGSHMCYECTGLCCRNHFQVSSNKCIEFTQLDPKLLFRCVSDHFVTMHKVVQNGSHMCYECTGLCSLNQF